MGNNIKAAEASLSNTSEVSSNKAIYFVGISNVKLYIKL